MSGLSVSLLGQHSPDHASPMSELARCFTGLSAFHTGDTPRRCLDLSNLSTGSPDAAGSPHQDKPTFLPVLTFDSPAPRKNRMKKLRAFLPRLLCSSPKLQPIEQPRSNKENVAPGQRQQGKPGSLLPTLESQLQVDSEPCVLGSPIYPAPTSPTQNSLGDADTDGFMDDLEQEAEGSVAVSMSCSMAQLLSEPLMNQEVDLSSVSVCRQGGRRLFRCPSMPERMERPAVKRTSTSPAAPRAIKRHCTVTVISEEGAQGQGDQGARLSNERRHLRMKTHSLCEVEQQLGGDGVNAELIGDFSKVHALPIVTGRHQDLKYITMETMCALLEGKFSCLVESFVVVDCRYPYEYQGGHITGALSMPNTDEAVEYLLSQRLKASSLDKRLVLVLHCEFSSERAPRTCRLLRSEDRSMNEYPALHYPELYILKGGYRDFYYSHQEHCEPRAYCPMHHQDHREELLRCRTHSRVSAEERSRRRHIHRLVKL